MGARALHLRPARDTQTLNEKLKRGERGIAIRGLRLHFARLPLSKYRRRLCLFSKIVPRVQRIGLCQTEEGSDMESFSPELMFLANTLLSPGGAGRSSRVRLPHHRVKKREEAMPAEVSLVPSVSQHLAGQPGV